MTKYISCADTAKLVRQALKESVPDVKFSVRSSVYSGGASITVRWTDGPNTTQVEAIAGVFSGAYFDGMQDLKGATYALLDGEQVRFGADFIFTTREISEVLADKAGAAVARRYGLATAPTGADWKKGLLNGARPAGANWGYDLRDLVWQQLVKMSDRLAVPKSKTAGKVIYLGNDGHSQNGALSLELAA